MKITVLFDEESSQARLKKGFGLSLLIDGAVLFDTGSDGDALLYNIKKLNIDIKDIKAVVLSHEHWDHTGGLRKLLPECDSPYVYTCPGFPPEIREGIISGGGREIMKYGPAKISERVYTTGEINGTYKDAPIVEQSVFIRYSGNRVMLVCGCAHYGIADKIGFLNDKIEKYFGKAVVLDFIVGGFHMKGIPEKDAAEAAKRLQDFGVGRAVPLHCSGKVGRDAFNRLYGNDCHNLKVGDVLEF